ncbi:FAD binding domain-containing protein [Colletotrichum tamarilloi]|uniref:FAD binding domain-containing protein n=1 Tax=Colletotrichum tamarilloi TaxID=1209934 RepID=A0ABQ9QHS1_9PEZI|nr:FAD binding domain-containing protein [Colletotrichum tamarilloi]KAK1470476.1 FAD binding domain-containing protein [Colletotrichum tamarilloi]
MASQDHHGIKQVIVIGTGPTGLLLSLLLARHSIPVLLLDKSASLDTQPRATHYAAPANRVLSRANLLARVRQHGIEVGGARWRKPDGTVLAKIENSRLGAENPDRISCLPLNALCKMALEDLEKEPAAEVRWGCEVEGIREEESRGRAVVVVKTEEGAEELEADYVVGCDGANSIIRRQLFGDEFPGYTWDLQIVATNVSRNSISFLIERPAAERQTAPEANRMLNTQKQKVYYDFEKYGWKDSNFVIHPTDYFMAAKIQDDGLWRVSYGEVPGLSHDEYRARQPAKYETMLPGNPKANDYRIVNFSPYKVHQRLAPRMRVGRFILAGDAAHLCNPFGGMGLTGGIVDVGDLFDCLAGIHDRRADDDILDKYDRYRREKFNQFTNPVSEANLKRMASDPDEVEANDPGIVAMREADKTDEAAITFQLGILGLAHDMTQYYKKYNYASVVTNNYLVAIASAHCSGTQFNAYIYDMLCQPSSGESPVHPPVHRATVVSKTEIRAFETKPERLIK